MNNMKSKNLKKNLAYIIPILLILCFIIFKVCTMDISGATLEYDLNDNPNLVSAFTEAKNEDKALILNGKNDNLSYTWIYDKGKVSDNKKTDLLIKPYLKYKNNIIKTLDSKNILSFKFSKNIELNGTPRLNFKDIKTKGNSYLFKLTNAKISFVTDTVSNDNDITLDVKETDGIYILASGISNKNLNIIKNKSLSLKVNSKKEKDKIEEDTKKKTTKDKSSSKKTSSKSSKKSVKKNRIQKSEGRPINLDDQKVDKETTLSCTLTVECKDILDNKDMLKEGKEDCVPSDGYIYGPRKVTFYEGENIYDVLEREMRNSGIPFDADGYTEYSSAYIRGINNLYEFDCGKSSGWLYYVNGSRPNFGCSRYVLSNGDNIHWEYSVK